MKYSSPFSSKTTYDIDHDYPWEALADAIILCAVEDYRHPERISTDPNYRYSDRCRAYVRSEVERFIRSDWFQLLTTLDPELLIEKLREEQRHV